MKIWYPKIIIIFHHFTFLCDPEFFIRIHKIRIIKLEEILILIDNYCKVFYLNIYCFPTNDQCSFISIIGLTVANIIYSNHFNLISFLLFPQYWLRFNKIVIKLKTNNLIDNLNLQINDHERISSALEINKLRTIILHSYDKKF
ncbi:hypothetical protein (nucleomorph) [Guillardia theta]|uniref:Uncharacterized protein n=1 Tax=Guillardia theta TaxID=55529 RepID=Q9SEV6_GUITH|nr:hypothetical protein GTHECHR3138 [Guillardia theta]AAF24009.1 hypothetical protein [Guillardia theta]